MKDEFISTVSHELRTPLTSIRAFSEILHDNENLEISERQKFTSIIIKETNRLTRLVNQILDLAKIESGKMEWYVCEVDLAQIVQEAVDATRMLFENKSVQLINQVPDRCIMLQADRDKLIQVAINLLSNAIKFCNPQDGVVKIELRKSPDAIGLAIIDNGVGIAQEDLERVFERFHQVYNSPVNLPLGTGLGLTICRRIIERHNGKIWAESLLGQGTSFIFLLPHSTTPSMALL